jgi:hypothetical protein
MIQLHNSVDDAHFDVALWQRPQPPLAKELELHKARTMAISPVHWF